MSRSFDIGCTVRVEVSAERCRADVELDGGIPLDAGDRVRVHGEPVRVRIGQSLTFRRTATVEQAGLLRRLRAKVAGYFTLTELYEVSFLPGVGR